MDSGLAIAFADISLGLRFALFRIGWVLGTVALLLLVLRFRPRPLALLAVTISANVVAWLAYVLPLPRLYALDEGIDRSFNVGMAAVTAAGNSPFEHTQAGFGSLEPLWNVVIAAMALMRPENVVHVYHWLPPLALVVVSLGLYLGLRTGRDEDDAWERALIVFSLLGLSSFSLGQAAPLLPTWAAQFLLKPQHAMAWAVTGLVLGLHARRAAWWKLGLALGLLAWAFIIDWAFVSIGLVVGELLRPRQDRRLGSLAASGGLSALVASPYLMHLWHHYNPTAPSGNAHAIWRSNTGRELAYPHLLTIDLGLLLVLAILGCIVLWRRRTSRDITVLGLVGGAAVIWAGYGVGAIVGIAPEPDEPHHFIRMTLAIAAGAGLAAGARLLRECRGWSLPRATLLVAVACVPLTFHAWWDPPNHDPYYRLCDTPIPQPAFEMARWVRANTPHDAIFATGDWAGSWIPAFSGRRVLLVSGRRPPADYMARKRAERILLTSRNEAKIAATARKFGIGYVVIDPYLRSQLGKQRVERLRDVGIYESVFDVPPIRIYRIRLD